jgi:ribose transport system substrate-binding protein
VGPVFEPSSIDFESGDRDKNRERLLKEENDMATFLYSRCARVGSLALMITGIAAARAEDASKSATSSQALHTAQKCDQTLSLEQLAAFKAPKANKRYKVAYSMVSLAGYFYQATAYGATKAAEDAGVDLTLNAAQGFASQAQQITNVRNQLSRNIDGLVINPVDVNGSVAAVEAAAEKNVPVVSIGSLTNTAKAIRIVQDDYTQGEAAAEYIASKLPDGGSGVVMGGPANATWALRRVAGFQDELKKHPNLVISTVTNENVDPAEGLVKFSDAVRVHPKVDWIYSTYNLLLPPGTVPSNFSKALYVAGGLDELTISALKNATASAILPDYPVSEGYLGVAYLVRKLNGEELPSITCLPNGIVTSSNLESAAIQSQNLFPAGWKAAGH